VEQQLRDLSLKRTVLLEPRKLVAVQRHFFEAGQFSQVDIGWVGLLQVDALDSSQTQK